MRYYKDEGKNTNVKSKTVKLPELENQVSSGLQRDLEIIWSSLTLQISNLREDQMMFKWEGTWVNLWLIHVDAW